jgi:hypothetical protein
MNKRFSRWIQWEGRHELDGLDYPGIYAIARSNDDLTGRAFTMREEIVYFGMTNSIGGLRSRLGQFERTISGGSGHGGAHRVRSRHPNYERLICKLYVAVSYTKCDVESTEPKDLLLMGDVARQEFECWALYVRKFGRLPRFNDKKRSPKKQLNSV